MKKIVLLTTKWILFIIASALASLIVYETINITPGIQTSSLKISFMLLAWIGWGVISVYNSKQESLEEFSKSHQVFHHIAYFFLLMAVFGTTLTFVFLSYSTVFPSPVLPPPPSAFTSANVLSPTAVPSEGLGTPHVFTPDMWQPQAYKSDDFVDTGIAYDPNYDPRRDPVNALHMDFGDKVVDMETHSYQHGSMSQGGLFDNVAFVWKEAGKPDQALTIEGYGITGLDDNEIPRARNFLTGEGFTPVPANDQNGMTAHKKDQVICMYKESGYDVSLYCTKLQ